MLCGRNPNLSDVSTKEINQELRHLPEVSLLAYADPSTKKKRSETAKPNSSLPKYSCEHDIKMPHDARVGGKSNASPPHLLRMSSNEQGSSIPPWKVTGLSQGSASSQNLALTGASKSEASLGRYTRIPTFRSSLCDGEAKNASERWELSPSPVPPGESVLSLAQYSRGEAGAVVPPATTSTMVQDFPKKASSGGSKRKQEANARLPHGVWKPPSWEEKPVTGPRSGPPNRRRSGASAPAFTTTRTNHREPPVAPLSARRKASPAGPLVAQLRIKIRQLEEQNRSLREALASDAHLLVEDAHPLSSFRRPQSFREDTSRDVRRSEDSSPKPSSCPQVKEAKPSATSSPPHPRRASCAETITTAAHADSHPDLHDLCIEREKLLHVDLVELQRQLMGERCVNDSLRSRLRRLQRACDVLLLCDPSELTAEVWSTLLEDVTCAWETKESPAEPAEPHFAPGAPHQTQGLECCHMSAGGFDGSPAVAAAVHPVSTVNKGCSPIRIIFPHKATHATAAVPPNITALLDETHQNEVIEAYSHHAAQDALFSEAKASNTDYFLPNCAVPLKTTGENLDENGRLEEPVPGSSQGGPDEGTSSRWNKAFSQYSLPFRPNTASASERRSLMEKTTPAVNNFEFDAPQYRKEVVDTTSSAVRASNVYPDWRELPIAKKLLAGLRRSPSTSRHPLFIASKSGPASPSLTTANTSTPDGAVFLEERVNETTQITPEKAGDLTQKSRIFSEIVASLSPKLKEDMEELSGLLPAHVATIHEGSISSATAAEGDWVTSEKNTRSL